MPKLISTVGKFYRKCAGQVRLLRTDPEAFASNVRQFTDPAGYEAKLLDIMEIPAVRATVCSAAVRTLNIVLPEITQIGLTGGPNTALNLGYRIAAAGLPVRFVSANATIEADQRWFWTHLTQLTGITSMPPNVSLVSAAERPLEISADDHFMATFWTTARQIMPLLELTRSKSFIYLIQDFEPGFYAWSSNHALALETYSMPFLPVINEATLADFLSDNRVGRFADPAVRQGAIVFEPGCDRATFHPGSRDDTNRPRRLLVYARPKLNARNLLGMAIASLRSAIAAGAFADWEVFALGARGSLPEIRLGNNKVLKETPWQDLAGYARLLRKSDILLCPMLSPHTSYPVIEMAASGGLTITNGFGAKTAANLAELSPNIITVAPTVAGFAAALAEASRRAIAGYDRHAPVKSPTSWAELFDDAQRRIVARVTDA